MEEILPGIYHWTQTHPKIKIAVSSYYLRPERVLIDPLIPDEGLDWFTGHPPENIYLSIRHHYRHCAEFSQEYGCTVWCVEQGMHEFTCDESVRPFQFGETLPGQVEAIEIGSILSLLPRLVRCLGLAFLNLQLQDEGPSEDMR